MLKGLKIGFLGDSITVGHGSTNPKEKSYVSLISKKTGAVCKGYGISGTRIARQSEPEKYEDFNDFNTRVEQMDADLDVIAVFGGTNDYGHGNAEFGTFDDRTPDTFYGALHTLYTSLIKKYTTSKIIVITPLHRINENCLRGDGSKTKDMPTLKVYVEAIREVAEYYSLPVLDLYSASGLQPEVPEINNKYFVDGLHPSDSGYELLAEKIISFLKTL